MTCGHQCRKGHLRQSPLTSLAYIIAGREILLWDIGQMYNWLVNITNVKICWRTLQIHGSLPKDTTHIILFIFQFCRERRWRKCLNCSRLQPLAPPSSSSSSLRRPKSDCAPPSWAHATQRGHAWCNTSSVTSSLNTKIMA